MINTLYVQINNKKSYQLSLSTGVYNIIQREREHDIIMPHIDIKYMKGYTIYFVYYGL